jgi:alpha-beta hydrolase superfamily lysophospholipase
VKRIDPDRPAADDYRSTWGSFFEDDELELLERTVSTLRLQSGPHKLCIRLFSTDPDAPTVVIAHGMLGYGVPFARFYLPFIRSGFNVMQFDFPGMGFSSGRRGAATIDDLMRAWRRVLDWATVNTNAPIFVAANAEDGVLAYYALANQPSLTALSVHTLFEYGDPRGAYWLRPWPAFHVVRFVLKIAAARRPTLGVPGTWTIPWRHVFAGDDANFRKRLLADPHALRRGEASLGYGLLRGRKPHIPFELCNTPVQIIASGASRIWPAQLCRGSFERLCGPKEYLELPGAPHWDMSRAFHDAYCERVIAWFQRWYDSTNA